MTNNSIHIEEFYELSLELKSRIDAGDNIVSIVNSYDQNLSKFIVENEYTNIIGSITDYLLDKLLGEDLADHLRWYLYEFDGTEMSITDTQGKIYVVNNHSDFIESTKQIFGLEDSPND